MISPRVQGALGAMIAAALGVAAAWGFTVDDALISARVAAHLAQGVGYRFNADGPRVDCVTPLGWAWLLVPFAGRGALAALAGSAGVGAVLWVLAAARLGQLCAELCSGARQLSLWLCLALSLPLGAWAVSGMETALVLALGVGALSASGWGALAAGLAAALRPELLPWAVTLSLGQALVERRSLGARALALVCALLPALLVAALRTLLFGRAVPLAVFAKPSDFAHGLRYGFGVLLLSGLPFALLGGSAWRQVSRRYWVFAFAFGVHVVTLIGIGGDWMPFWRLAVPAFPSLLVAGAALAAASSGWSQALRVGLVVASAALLHWGKGSAARGVRGERARLIAALRPWLEGAERVASVDVGWVGASADVHVVDLAGATDEAVAFLPGGHTSKRLPRDFLERERVDLLVLRRAARVHAGDPERWVYTVDSRVLGLRGGDDFERVAELPLGEGSVGSPGGTHALGDASAEAYVVWRRRSAPSAEAAR